MDENDIRDMAKKIMSDILNDGSDTPSGLPYATFEEYKAIKNKQFRRTREQVKQGISREEAFALHLESLKKTDSPE